MTGNVWVHYSNPDPECMDASHNKDYRSDK
jgi:hypothetical protein